MARAIHYHSGRTGRFVAVNCASVSDSLFESEFFGHRRGAFTGALADRAGWFELADNGTLLLDEVGDMPLNQQAKLLRAIQEGVVVPVGATDPVVVSARAVTATNQDLDKLVNEGRFRRDLLDRLDVLPLRLPLLRERKEDFELLVDHFLTEANAEEATRVERLRRPAMALLRRDYADGSIRVLRNAIRRLALLKRCGSVGPAGLNEIGLVVTARRPASPHIGVRLSDEAAVSVTVTLDGSRALDEVVAEVERAVTDALLRKNDGRVIETMRELGVTKDVWYRIRR